MKYLNTREIYLNILNETLVNEITWGGSLLGRLVNSTLRLAKIGVNYTRVGSIAGKIKDELDKLIEEGLPETIKEDIPEIMVLFLLEEIHNCVIDKKKSDLDKRIELLDKGEDSGLISKAIELLNELDDNSILFGEKLGSKSELISKLEKFREELQKMGDISEEEIDDYRDKFEEFDEEDDAEKIDSEEEEFYKETLLLVKNSLTLAEFINLGKLKFKKPEKIQRLDGEDVYPNMPDEKDKRSFKFTKKIDKTGREIESPKEQEKIGTSNNPKRIEGPNNPKELKAGNEPKRIEGPKESLLLNFESFIFEKENKEIVKSKINNNNYRTNNNDVEDLEIVDETSYKYAPIIWNKILSAYKKSNLSKNIPILKNVLTSTKEEVIKFGKQIMINRNTVGGPLSFDDLIKEDMMYNNASKSLSLFLKVVLGLNGQDMTIDLLEGANEIIKDIIDSYNKLSILYKQLSPIKESEEISKFENKVEIAYKNAGFIEGEEKKWKANIEKVKELNREIEKSKVDIDSKKSKDRIIKIVNLFGKAYNIIVTSVIPSGRPDGRVSNKTYRQYIFLGRGMAGVPHNDKGPGYGPWASRAVLNKFKRKINKLIEDNEYKKIFNNGVIRRTDGEELKGNVLLEFMRDMTDENTLKSFDKNRTKFLNKYFGLDVGKTEQKEKFDLKEREKEILKDRKFEVNWNTINFLSEEKNTAVGSFLALNCNYKTTGTRPIEKTALICAYIIAKNGNRIMFKYQVESESFVKYYSDLSEDNIKAIELKEYDDRKPVRLGMIDLSEPIKKNDAFKIVYCNLGGEVKDEVPTSKIHPNLFKIKDTGNKSKPTRNSFSGMQILSKIEGDKILAHKGTALFKDSYIKDDKKIDIGKSFNLLSDTYDKIDWG